MLTSHSSANKCRTCIGSFGGAKTCTEEKPLSCLDTFYLGLDQFDYTICAKCANNPLFVNRDRINTCDSIAILSCLDGFTLLNGACEPTWARFRNIYAPLAASGSAQNTPECYSLSVTGAVNAFRWEDQLILKTCFLNEVTYGSLTAVQNQYSTYVQGESASKADSVGSLRDRALTSERAVFAGSCTGIKEVNTASKLVELFLRVCMLYSHPHLTSSVVVAAPCTDVVWLPGTPATCTGKDKSLCNVLGR